MLVFLCLGAALKRWGYPEVTSLEDVGANQVKKDEGLKERGRQILEQSGRSSIRNWGLARCGVSYEWWYHSLISDFCGSQR